MHQTSNEFAPASQGELQRFVQENDSGERLALYPVGGRTSLNFGRAATRPGTLVSLAKLTQTVDYPVRDMTITIEAGIRMDELAALLREQGQQLPIDVAQSNRATLGGVVATNAAGPRRYGLGTMRDYVIGLTAIDAGGRIFHSGGRVVKNVAGYDICKLMVGSLGSLAIITQLTLKLKPLPESTVLLWTPFSTFAEIDTALNDLQESSARPVVLDVLNASAAKHVSAESRQDLPCDGPVLVIGLEGTARETAWQVESLKDELHRNQPGEIAVSEDESATRLLQALTEFPTASDAPLTFQAGLLPSKTLQFIEQATSQNIAIQSHAGDGLVIGHLPDKASSIEQVAQLLKPLRELACSGRGNLVVLNCDADWAKDLPIMGEPEPGWPLMQQLKKSLDPHNILNPGRFVFCEST
jgi:glycolate oxidase FAD binding subunit